MSVSGWCLVVVCGALLGPEAYELLDCGPYFRSVMDVVSVVVGVGVVVWELHSGREHLFYLSVYFCVS